MPRGRFRVLKVGKRKYYLIPSSMMKKVLKGSGYKLGTYKKRKRRKKR